MPGTEPRTHVSSQVAVICATGAATQGHGVLAGRLRQEGFKHVGWSGSASQRLVAATIKRLTRRRGTSPEIAWERLMVRWLIEARGMSLVHLLWADGHLDDSPLATGQLVLTLHQPLSRLRLDSPTLAAARAVITMADREAKALAAAHPGLRTRAIPHGVDTRFWCPGSPSRDQGTKQVVFAGRYLRNLPMFVRVARRLVEERRDVRVKWLVNPDFVIPPDLESLLPGSGVTVVRGLSDVELREFYRSAEVMIAPYSDVTASNSIVEAMACGLPIVATDVGGMRFYDRLGGMILVANDDDDAMCRQVLRLLESPDELHERRRVLREDAETRLEWKHVVREHLECYRECVQP